LWDSILRTLPSTLDVISKNPCRVLERETKKALWGDPTQDLGKKEQPERGEISVLTHENKKPKKPGAQRRRR